MKDRSTKVGGRRNAVGNDMTAGNSITKPGRRRKFQDSKTFAVAREDKRYAKSLRSGRRRAV